MEKDQRKPISEKAALSRMMRICSRKEYCSFDIRQKLKRLNIDDEITEQIINTLKKNNFIDNARYTRSYINDKLRFSKWGKTKIVYALRAKRIESDIIENSFSEFDDELLTKELRPLLIRKMKSVKGTDDYEKRNKVIRYGLGRGFAMDDIISCLDKIAESE